MIKLDTSSHSKVFDLYRQGDFIFPLIGAVLLGEQDGFVYVDDYSQPRQVYVEHSFGFAQIFGETNPAFETDLRHYLLTSRRFACAKVRLYAPSRPKFLDGAALAPFRSFRQRFFLEPGSLSRDPLPKPDQFGGMTPVTVGECNIDLIERTFGVVRRFWRGTEDFIHKANAVAVLYRGRPASICYSAAQMGNQVEIDVFTLPGYRGLGAGRSAVTHFLKRCFEQSLRPLWDCFTNNVGSMNLCRAVGFVAPRPPYPFFTIPKQDDTLR